MRKNLVRRFLSKKLRGIKKTELPSKEYNILHQRAKRARIFFLVEAYCLKGISDKKAKRDKRLKKKIEFFKI